MKLLVTSDGSLEGTIVYLGNIVLYGLQKFNFKVDKMTKFAHCNIQKFVVKEQNKKNETITLKLNEFGDPMLESIEIFPKHRQTQPSESKVALPSRNQHSQKLFLYSNGWCKDTILIIDNKLVTCAQTFHIKIGCNMDGPYSNIISVQYRLQKEVSPKDLKIVNELSKDKGIILTKKPSILKHPKKKKKQGKHTKIYAEQSVSRKT